MNRTRARDAGFPSKILRILVLPLVLTYASAAQTNEFGSAEYSREALIGILYDLKQNQKRESVPMNIGLYYKVIEQFTSNGWDENILNRYFRAARALYTTEIFITHRPAAAGPAAFGVENLVRPSYWVAHYKGQVIPPKPGTYEFVASADGFIAVAVDGKTILIKHASNSEKYQTQLGGPLAGIAGGSRLRHSLPFVSDGKTPIDLDLILAEAGGQCNAFLLYCREGDAYPKDATGGDVYPVFQLGPHEIPKLGPDKAPAFEQRGEYWKPVP